MSGESGRKYPIVHGGIERRIRGIEARKKISRELHGLVVMQPTPRQCADWWYDLRKGRLRVYGALLRFIDVSVMQGVDRATLLTIPALIAAYINDQYDGRGDRTAPRKAA